MAPARITLLTNPVAGRGRGRAAAEVAAARFRSAGHSVDAVVGVDVDDTLALAQKAVADDVDLVVAVGGGGTVNVVLQALAGGSVPLGVVPCDAVPLAAADRIVAALTTGRRRRVDVARARGRYFASALRAGDRRTPRDYVIDLDGRPRRVSASTVTVRPADTGHGLLDVRVVERRQERERHRARRVTVAALGLEAHADGEDFGPLPITIECVPRALEVLS